MLRDARELLRELDGRIERVPGLRSGDYVQADDGALCALVPDHLTYPEEERHIASVLLRLMLDRCEHGSVVSIYRVILENTDRVGRITAAALVAFTALAPLAAWLLACSDAI